MADPRMTPEAVLEMWRIQEEEGVVPHATSGQILNLFAASRNLDGPLSKEFLAEVPRIVPTLPYPKRIHDFITDYVHKQRMLDQLRPAADALALACGVSVLEQDEWDRVILPSRNLLSVLFNPTGYIHVPQSVIQGQPIHVFCAPVQVTVGSTLVLAFRALLEPDRVTGIGASVRVIGFRYAQKNGSGSYSNIHAQATDPTVQVSLDKLIPQAVVALTAAGFVQSPEFNN